MSERSYIARADGWVAGRRVLQGEVIQLTPAAARYEPVDPAPQAKAGKTPRRAARDPEPAPEPEAVAAPGPEALAPEAATPEGEA